MRGWLYTREKTRGLTVAEAGDDRLSEAGLSARQPLQSDVPIAANRNAECQ